MSKRQSEMNSNFDSIKMEEIDCHYPMCNCFILLNNRSNLIHQTTHNRIHDQLMKFQRPASHLSPIKTSRHRHGTNARHALCSGNGFHGRKGPLMGSLGTKQTGLDMATSRGSMLVYGFLSQMMNRKDWQKTTSTS